MAELVELGSLYFGSRLVPAGAVHIGGRISFGNTVPGKSIPFVKWGNLYVADRCICMNVSWEELDNHEYIFGRPIKIDGNSYLCRSLKVGAEMGVHSEWDVILDDLGEDNGLWHWNKQYFWGQEEFSDNPLYCAVRGYSSARFWNRFTFSFLDDKLLGFRPVLEPLPPGLLVSGSLIGHTLKIYGKDCSFTGRLISYSDYDLEIASNGPLPEGCLWAKQMENSIFIDRESVDFVYEEGKIWWNTSSWEARI